MTIHKLATCRSLVDVLRQRAADTGDKIVFTFLGGDGAEEAVLTYQSLDWRARAIAAELQAVAMPGERALLLFRPGLEFIAAFFGCLYAGIVAVPAAAPGRNRPANFIDAIGRACAPAIILSTAEHEAQAKPTLASDSPLMNGSWLAVDQIDDEIRHAWRETPTSASQLAFLQYTSGSTSEPKGVMLSHENLLYNAGLVQAAFHTSFDSRGVFWLPLYHDMGLIGGVVQPIYCGGSSTLIAPATFLQRPSIWLETISRTRATISGGPDFAYDLCARKIQTEDRARLDLACWDVAFVGAERIRAQTIERFTAAFAPCGFRANAWLPCYGLAEATLLVSGGPWHAAPVILPLDSGALGKNEVRVADGDAASCRLVSCGENLCGQRLAIVDPETRQALSDNQVGEVWVQGPSVACGYHENPEATAETFAARLAEADRGPFLRTGDLGFLRQNQLFIAGRLKNLIIIRGRNHYPEDIEQTVNSACDGLRLGYCAAFSVDIDDQEQLVVVQEVEPRQRDFNADAAIRAIRAAIAERHDLEVYTVVLAKAGEVPKTSSGKTRRAACRERYLLDEVEVVAAWTAGGAEPPVEPVELSFAAAPRQVSAAEIELWLIDRITARLRLPAGQLSIETLFLDLGMGSLDAVEIAADLERWLGRQLSPISIYNYPTVAALAHWLAAPLSSNGAMHAAAIRASTYSGVTTDSELLLAEVRAMSDQDMEGFLAQELAKQQDL